MAEKRDTIQSDDKENVPQSFQRTSRGEFQTVKQNQHNHIETPIRSPDRPAGMSKEEKARIDAMLAQDDFTRTSAFSRNTPAAALSHILRRMDDELVQMKEQIGLLEDLNEGRMMYMDKASSEYKEAQKTFMKVKMAHLDLIYRLSIAPQPGLLNDDPSDAPRPLPHHNQYLRRKNVPPHHNNHRPLGPNLPIPPNQPRRGPATEFVLGTITPSSLPSVRYCIHRGFWAALPPNSHNKLPKNPQLYTSDCPVFTTDARMSKVYDIFATGKGKGDLEQSRSGTGGGGPVEAVYWIKDIKVQWRIRGKCWLVSADDVDGSDAQNSGTVTVKAQVGRYMRPADGVSEEESQRGKGEWSWRTEVNNWFENLSPGMRGSFKNPEPGKPCNEGVKNKGEALGQSAGHLEDEELARKNFRVAIITPEEVEQVDLSDPAAARRWKWTLAEEAGGQGTDSESKSVGEWDMVETWP
ncbi:uncharacterized protein AB675_9768 [Cyphellophora attinorum]|uniref:Pyridoxamine 5'-phosphate oxidase Alr4036 family FMN-binding domain-containing protein n=1 Tax=Cyphellophora attinorum TaxID=1664694 RepID=A0A0N1P0N7_9EURO|nr:uncharacterized protein AB675_9768 [Phialophora attinorum]KPI42344.1 hypothetical protein AB675_9768 [Phialophora attinorum]